MPPKNKAPAFTGTQTTIKTGCIVYFTWGVVVGQLDTYQSSQKPPGSGKSTVLQGECLDGKKGLDNKYLLSLPHILNCTVRLPRAEFITVKPTCAFTLARPVEAVAAPATETLDVGGGGAQPANATGGGAAGANAVKPEEAAPAPPTDAAPGTFWNLSPLSCASSSPTPGSPLDLRVADSPRVLSVQYEGGRPAPLGMMTKTAFPLDERMMPRDSDHACIL